MPKFTEAFSRQPESIQKVLKLAVERIRPEAIVLFGSRARKTHREHSDFDFACKFKKRDDTAWAEFLVDLKEAPWTLWQIDLVDYSELSKEYQKNIDQEGLLLYG